MASITSFGQTTNNTPALSKYEKRIIVILDTLKNDYYWQPLPSELIDCVLPDFNYEEELEKYPFRKARDSYWQELDNLLNKNLSEAFLISLLNKEYKRTLARFFSMIGSKLFACQSDSAYAALCHFIAANPEYYDIAFKLVENNRYKDELRNCLLQTPVDDKFVEYLPRYFRIFDKETDKQLLDKILPYIKDKLNTDPFAAALNAIAISSGYYRMKHNEFLDDEETENHRKEMKESGGRGEEFEEARNNYFRTWTNNVLRYYERQGNINE